ncbi:MAG: hypothetical protein LBT00_02555 [Spirochaetaceae bacterium]|nr:hypothetical protein [Spirochaetaceae bacterium]
MENDKWIMENEEYGIASLRSSSGPLAMTSGLSSLRTAKRRSNPDGEGFHAGLLRSALRAARPQ